MNQFSIPERFLCDVPTQTPMLIGDTTAIAHGTEDHPLFAELRGSLERNGWIRCQRSWSNGDTVLRSFYLNGVLFTVGDQFPCACAMKGKLKYG